MNNMKTYLIHGDAYSLRVAVEAGADLTGLVKAQLIELHNMNIVIEGWMYEWIEEVAAYAAPTQGDRHGIHHRKQVGAFRE